MATTLDYRIEGDDFQYVHFQLAPRESVRAEPGSFMWMEDGIEMSTSTGGGLSFSVGLVAGVLAGAFAGSGIRGLFRWEACEDPRELGRQVGGAALMGVGGVVALGCSVGQGVTGFATLAWSGPVTLAAIVAGALIGLRQLIGGHQPS